MSSNVLAITSLLAALVTPTVISAQTSDNVAVVINEASPDSQRIGEHYIKVRAIPATNVIRVTTTTEDTIARAAYTADIEEPIASAIRRSNLHDRLLYIVLTKGVPLRITGTEGRNGAVASVDSELTLLYRRMTGRVVPTLGKVPNPYFLGTQPVDSAAPFRRRDHDIYLVTRLAAYTADEAIALIDRGLAAVQDGAFVLDQRAGILDNPVGDRHLAEAQTRLGELGLADRVVFEATTNAARNVDGVLGYYSWGSNDPENRVRQTTMRFRPGALAAMFLSQDARTFEEPPREWMPVNEPRNRAALFRGSAQSLIADLIREGVTGVAGHVSEPYLESAIQPQILFPAYVKGRNLAEAFYLAMPDLSWQAVIIGDPLCAPFPREVTNDADLAALDESTGLPALFARRRIEVAEREFRGTPLAAVTSYVRGESRFVNNDVAGAREAFEVAVKTAPDFVAARLHLAGILERTAEYARATSEYREILRVNPKHVVALNNLAYNLGVREGQPQEARPLARRAFLLSPNNVLIADTLAWVEHLTGNSEEAARLYRKYAQRNTRNPELHLHAATVFAAVGDLRTAEAQFALATKLNPDLLDSEDTAKLRELLKKKTGAP
jgi:uncharacterized protein (TIGR03790 family)